MWLEEKCFTATHDFRAVLAQDEGEVVTRFPCLWLDEKCFTATPMFEPFRLKKKKKS